MIVGAISFGFKAAINRALRLRIFASTLVKSEEYPEYGTLGVDSIIQDPYSGCHLFCSSVMLDFFKRDCEFNMNTETRTSPLP